MRALKKIKMHWWILLGMIAGVLWGFYLHEVHYETLLEQARQNIVGPDWSPEALVAESRAIQSELQTLLKETIGGGFAHGLAEIFLALLKMIVIPLVVTSLICGVTRMSDLARLRRVGLRAGAWYMSTSLIAILTGLALVTIIRPGVGVDLPISLDNVEIPAPASAWEMALSVIPANIFESAANFELLPLIFFSILFGIFSLMVAGEYRERIYDLSQAIFEVMLKMTLFILALAPIGIAALIARLLATTGPDILFGVAWYALTVALALAIHAFITLPLLFWVLTRRNPYLVLRAMATTLITAFSTASSAGTLGLTLEQTERKVGVDNQIGGFVLPLGATINMDGTALYECVAVLFVAQVYATANPDFALTFGAKLTVVALALLVSVGAAGIPHAGLVMMVIIFEAVGLPLELVALLWTVDRPLDMMRTMVNVWSDTVGAVSIAHFEDAIDETVLFAETS